jgi:hypothetical protein
MPTVLKFGAATSWNPQGLSRPVQGLLCLYRKLMLRLDDRNTWTDEGKCKKGMAKEKVEEVTGQDNSNIEAICMALLESF